MRIKILGLVALAALVAVLGTVGLSQKPGAQADALPIPAVTSGTVACPTGVTTTICIPSGTAVTISGLFDEDDSCPAWGTAGCQASVSVTPAANVTSLNFAPIGTSAVLNASCTIDTANNGSVGDDPVNNCVSGAATTATVALPDGDPAANIFMVSTATAAALDANTVNNLWRLNLVLTATCSVNTTLTIMYTQDATTAQAQVTCVGTGAAGVLAITKIDQNGGFRAAHFGLGPPGFAVAEATMVTTSTSTDNPCLSNDTSSQPAPTSTNPFPAYSFSCATNPNNVNNAGLLPPLGAGGITIPTGRFVEVKEIRAPTNCTLVEIKLGPSTSTTIMPLSFPVTFLFDGTGFQVNSNGVLFGTVPGTRLDLTYVNSCGIPTGASVPNTQLIAVLGGGSYGLSNTTHLEIVPAPGSDDDARIDLRVRDSNNIPLVGAHVTMFTDKGYLAMRQDTTGATATVGGYDVIEPADASFGTAFSGDTCDQGNFLSSSNPFNATLTRPFFNNSAGNPFAATIQDGYTNSDGIISACLYVSSEFVTNITPGRATITAIVENASPFTSFAVPNIYAPQNLLLTTTVTVVGPPASVRVAASPTSLLCGEKATITATVTDSVGQNVSDHTRVELVSNQGSTIGGTGATLGFPGVGPVNPLASSAAETFSGVATAFLLTSTEHVGPYEVVVATGGSTGGVLANEPNFVNFLGQFGANTRDNFFILDALRANQPGVFGGVGSFSTAPVSAQVTVTCSLPVVAAPAAPSIPLPPIAIPRTGEGIRPPNTGDAGLADASGSSLTLVLAGVAAFVLAGAVSFKLARR